MRQGAQFCSQGMAPCLYNGRGNIAGVLILFLSEFYLKVLCTWSVLIMLRLLYASVIGLVFWKRS